MMFTELKKLLAKRSLTITVAVLEDPAWEQRKTNNSISNGSRRVTRCDEIREPSSGFTSHSPNLKPVSIP